MPADPLRPDPATVAARSVLDHLTRRRNSTGLGDLNSYVNELILIIRRDYDPTLTALQSDADALARNYRMLLHEAGELGMDEATTREFQGYLGAYLDTHLALAPMPLATGGAEKETHA